MIENSYHLLVTLKKAGYIKNERDSLWWPDSLTESVVIGAILTQQTKWENVEKSLENLRNSGFGSLSSIAVADEEQIIQLIKPSGFYNTKAARLIQLSKNILDKYGSFKEFQKSTDRNWLLEQKGIGKESADSILCYACGRDSFVVDSYTGRLLSALGYGFGEYDEIQEWMLEGIEQNMDRIYELYGKELNKNTIYARMHGKIVEFAKDNIKGKSVNLKQLTNN